MLESRRRRRIRAAISLKFQPYINSGVVARRLQPKTLLCYYYNCLVHVENDCRVKDGEQEWAGESECVCRAVDAARKLHKHNAYECYYALNGNLIRWNSAIEAQPSPHALHIPFIPSVSFFPSLTVGTVDGICFLIHRLCVLYSSTHYTRSLAEQTPKWNAFNDRATHSEHKRKMNEEAI